MSEHYCVKPLLLYLLLASALSICGTDTVVICEESSGHLPCMTENGILRYSEINSNPVYFLGAYQRQHIGGNWPLKYYVDLARKLIISFNKIDWEYVVQLYLENGMAMDIKETAIQMLKMEKAVLAGAGLGILLIIFLIPCSLCVCCCRCCCNNCGAKLKKQPPKRQNKCCCIFVGIMLLLGCCIFLVCLGALYTLSVRIPLMKDLTENSLDYAIEDIETFKETLFSNVRKITTEDLEFSVNALFYKLNNIGDEILQPFMTNTRPQVNELLSTIKNTENGISDVVSGIEGFASALSVAGTVGSNMASQLTDIGNAMQNLIDSCNADLTIPSTICDDLNALPAELPPPVDLNTIPPVEDTNSLLGDVLQINFTAIRGLVNSAFDGLPALVNEQSSDIIEGVHNDFDNVTEMLQPNINEAESQINEFLNDAKENKDELKARIVELMLSMYFKEVVQYVFISLASLVFVVLIPSALGFSCGLIGYCSVPQGRKKTKSCAYCCLLTGATFCVFIGFLFLLIGIPLFLLGANLTLICHDITTFEIFEHVVDNPALWNGNYILSKMLYNDGSYHFTVEEALENCKANEAIYKAMKAIKVIDLEAQIDLESQIPDPTPVKDNVQTMVDDFVLLDAATRSDILSLSAIPGSNFVTITNSINQLLDDLNSVDLMTVKTTLMTQRLALISVPSLSTQCLDVYNDVDYLDTIISQLTTHLDHMKNNLTMVESAVLGLQTVGTDILARVDDLDDFIAGPGLNLIQQAIDNFMESIRSIARQVLEHIIDVLNNDLGQCGLIYDLYMGVVNTVCIFLLDGLNGLWLSLCTGGFFCCFNFGFSLAWTKYIRRLEKPFHIGRDYNFLRQSHRPTVDEIEKTLSVSAPPRPSLVKLLRPKHNYDS